MLSRTKIPWRNGLLTYDREILKVNGESISRINRELLQAFENLYN